MKRIVLYIMLIGVLALLACKPGGSSDESAEVLDDAKQQTVYSNPIDAYYLPLIENAGTQIEYRDYQDNYEGAWKSEYENILTWMKGKCVYQADIDNLNAYDAAVVALIDATHTVAVTDWLDDYETPPDSPERGLWGNGTRSGLNQVQGEIYRDAGMRLIGRHNDYIFMERDYAALQDEGL